MKITILIALIGALGGCATGDDWHWNKQGSSQNEFNMDSGQCRAQALSGTGGMVNIGTVMIMHSCLEGKGWQKVANR